MAKKIARLADPQLGSLLLAHYERIAIIETQVGRHPDPERHQSSPNLLLRHVAAFQNLPADRPRIVRISLKPPTPQRLPDDDGSTHALLMDNLQPCVLKQLLSDFTKHIRVRERLRPNRNRLPNCRPHDSKNRAEAERPNTGTPE